MPVIIPGNAQLNTLQDLYRAMRTDSEADNKAVFPVDVPNETPQRLRLIQRLLTLFGRGLEAALSQKRDRLKVDYPIPGQISATLADGDLELLESLAVKVLPAPEDPEFASAVKDRVAGVIAVLGGIIDFQANGKDTGATIRAFAQITRDVGANDEQQALIDTPWTSPDKKSRSKIIEGRLKSLAEASKTASLITANAQALNQVHHLAHTASQTLGGMIEGAIKEAFAKIFQYAPTKLLAAQWGSVLLKRLQTKVPWGSPADAENALRGIKIALMQANSPETLTAAIDGFMATKQ